MSVHIQALSNKDLNLVLRIYTGVPNHVPAYSYRLNYDVLCLATIVSGKKKALIQGMRRGASKITKTDYIDIGEKLHQNYGVEEVEYERAEGYVMRLRRLGNRRWRRVRMGMLEAIAVEFSGMPEE